jgi:hypothetical protein
MTEEVALDITVPPELETGAYANFAVISTQTPHDFTLDFIQVMPADQPPARGIVVARLKLAPSFLMPLMQTLSTHLAQYEEQMRQMEQAQEEGEGSQ